MDSQRKEEEGGDMGESQDEKLGMGASAPGIGEAAQALEPVLDPDATTLCAALGRFPLCALVLSPVSTSTHLIVR